MKPHLELSEHPTNVDGVAYFHLHSSQFSLLVNMDLNRIRVSKEWVGADDAYLVLSCLQTSTNVNNLGFVPKTA